MCGKSMEFSAEQLIAAQYKVTCPQCASALEIVGDYAYMPLPDGSLNLADDTDKQEEETRPQVDPLYRPAVDFIVTCNAITPHMLAQYFGIPMERAMQLMDQLERNGVVGPDMGGAPRTILIPHNNNIPGPFVPRYNPQTPPPFRGPQSGTPTNGNNGNNGTSGTSGGTGTGNNGAYGGTGTGDNVANGDSGNVNNDGPIFPGGMNGFPGGMKGFPGNFHGKTYTINCSGCLFVLLLILLIATFFAK